MNKSDISRAMASGADITQGEAKSALDAALEAIAGALAEGDKVSIPGFGTFSVRHRAARAGRNLQTGEAIQIAASKNAAFKAGKTLKERLN